MYVDHCYGNLPKITKIRQKVYFNWFTPFNFFYPFLEQFPLPRLEVKFKLNEDVFLIDLAMG